jgi:hypothetical protein
VCPLHPHRLLHHCAVCSSSASLYHRRYPLRQSFVGRGRTSGEACPSAPRGKGGSGASGGATARRSRSEMRPLEGLARARETSSGAEVAAEARAWSQEQPQGGNAMAGGVARPEANGRALPWSERTTMEAKAQRTTPMRRQRSATTADRGDFPWVRRGQANGASSQMWSASG